ncbi:S9 family peptidase [Neobacillus sp. Marseille-QA0830]
MEKRRLVPEDLYQYTWISDAVVNAQGTIAFVERRIDKTKNNYSTTIGFLSVDGGEISKLSDGGKDFLPAWSPDGKELAFLREVDGVKQIFVVKEDGSHAIQLTHFKYGIGSYKWSPKGDLFLFTSKIREEESPKSDKGNVYQDLPFKSEGTGLKDNRYHHLFLFNRKNQQVTQLTSGRYDVSNPRWSPEGERIVFLLNNVKESTGSEKKGNTNDIHSINLATKQIEKRTDSGLLIHQFNFSSDGNSYYLIANNQEFGSGTQNQLYVVSSDDPTPKSLSSSFPNLQIGNYALSDMKFAGGYPAPIENSRGDWTVLGTKHGSVNIYGFSQDGTCSPITEGDKDVYHYTLTEDGRYILFLAVTSDCPGELYKRDLLSGEEIKLTNYHDELLHSLHPAKIEEFWFNSFDDTKIQGWIMGPTQVVETDKTPLIIQIHGGPHAMYTGTFNHEFQVLVSKGYSVMFLNPRGSFGYGQEFATACRGDICGGDYQDIICGLEYVLNHYSFIDPKRLGVAGGSYGGLMTNWIVSHSNRFKAAITQRCISNWLSFYGMSDIGASYTEAMVGGNPWDDTTLLWEKSPLAHVRDIETPLLIIHGEEDLRCPVEQGDQLYTALKKRNRETKLVRFPKSNHSLAKNGKPSYRVHLLEEVVSWFEEYI